MKKINVQIFAAITIVFVFTFSAGAQDASSLYKTKCVACHGPDGSGSATGTKLGVHDFHSADVQKQSDADLTGIIVHGKNKMPAYGKSLKAEDITVLVAYIRSQATAK